MAPKDHAEGWAFVVQSGAAHYFRNGQSLCKAWGNFETEVEFAPDPTADDFDENVNEDATSEGRCPECVTKAPR